MALFGGINDQCWDLLLNSSQMELDKSLGKCLWIECPSFTLLASLSRNEHGPIKCLTFTTLTLLLVGKDDICTFITLTVTN